MNLSTRHRSWKSIFKDTVLFGLVVLILKIQHLPTPITPSLFNMLIVARLIVGILSVEIYLRGGVVLTWWLGFLVQLHLLWGVGAQPE